MTGPWRLLEWMRERRAAKSSARSEPEPDIDPIEELVRIVGEADANEPRLHAKPTTARRVRSRPRG